MGPVGSGPYAGHWRQCHEEDPAEAHSLKVKTPRDRQFGSGAVGGAIGGRRQALVIRNERRCTGQARAFSTKASWEAPLVPCKWEQLITLFGGGAPHLQACNRGDDGAEEDPSREGNSQGVVEEGRWSHFFPLPPGLCL